jgi:hypothetical protein
MAAAASRSGPDYDHSVAGHLAGAVMNKNLRTRFDIAGR